MAGIIGILVVLLIGVWGHAKGDESNEALEALAEADFALEKEKKEPVKEIEKPNVVVIEVKGAVKQPGVYQLSSDARVIDALKKAGGIESTANLDRVNQASPLVDGMVIYVPHEGENVDQIPMFQTQLTSMDTNTSYPSQKVRINHATIEELKKLNGIGEAKARAIWDYRQEHGPFRSLEELANVPGIGEKTVQKFQDQIVLD